MTPAELKGVALDWAVAKCEGVEGDDFNFADYSTNWALAGLIIEREEIEITIDPAHHKYEGQEIKAHIYPNTMQYGKTYLEAAMRCYVASKLGNEIEIPKEIA